MEQARTETTNCEPIAPGGARHLVGERPGLLPTRALRTSPPVPWVAVRLLQTFAADYDSIRLDDIVRLVRTDSTLAAEVLKRVNSALYALPSPVDDLGRAAVMLGLCELRQLTLKAALRCFCKPTADSRHARRFWRHSLACAHLGEEMAHVFPLQPDLVYVAGLLHDIGRTILLHEFPEEYGRLLDRTGESSAGGLEQERRLFGTDHCELGAALAQQSRFPEGLTAVAAHHHCPRQGDELDVAGIVHIACRLADATGFGCTSAPPAESPKEVIQDLPAVNGALIQDALDEVVEAVKRKIALEE